MVRLRHLQPAEVSGRYVAWLNDVEVTRYLDVGRSASTLESVRTYVASIEASGNDLLWAIVERSGGMHIGNVTLNRIDRVHRRADTGLLIGEKAFWGKGCATEAWRLAVGHAFRGLALHKVVAGACSANVGSIRALERVGFKVEGVLRDEFLLDGRYLDVLRLGVLEGELVPGSVDE